MIDVLTGAKTEADGTITPWLGCVTYDEPGAEQSRSRETLMNEWRAQGVTILTVSADVRGGFGSFNLTTNGD